MIDLSGYQTSIDTERFILRTLQPGDASERYVSWLNDPIVNRYLETRQTTRADIERYIEEKMKSPTCVFFGIFWKETGEHIGNVKLEPVDQENGTAVMGILIGEPAFWGKGIATEVTQAISTFAFATLGLSEITLGVISENKAAIRVYEKCGFVTYRVDREALDHEGKKFDQVWMKKQHL